MIIRQICFCSDFSDFYVSFFKIKKRFKDFFWIFLKETWKEAPGLKRRLAGPRFDSLPHALSPGRVNCVVPLELKTFLPFSTPECVRSCQAWRAGCAWRATSPRCSREALPRLTITPITMATAVRHRWVVLLEQMTTALLSYKKARKLISCLPNSHIMKFSLGLDGKWHWQSGHNSHLGSKLLLFVIQ